MPCGHSLQSSFSSTKVCYYHGKFIDNLSELKAPLSSVLIKGFVFSLDKPQIVSNSRIEEVLTTAPVLNFDSPSQTTRVLLMLVFIALEQC